MSGGAQWTRASHDRPPGRSACPVGRHIWGMTTNYGGDWVASATQHSRRIAPAVEAPSIDTPPTPARGTNGRGSQSLRRILVLLDATAVFAAWAIALTFPDGLDRPGWSHFPNLMVAVALATGASLAMIASQRLYLARVCSVRAVETVRLGRTAVMAALLLQAGERRLGIHVSLNESVGGAL